MTEENKKDIRINLGMNFIMLFWNALPFDVSSRKRIEPMMESIENNLDIKF